MTTDNTHTTSRHPILPFCDLVIYGHWYADGAMTQFDLSGGISDVERKGQPSPGVEPYMDCQGWLAPGFVDIQVNGYGGIDYSGDSLSINDVDNVIDALAAAGTTRHFPTIITNAQDRICQNLEVLHDIAQSSVDRRTAIAGLHVEGPYISSEDGPRGAHDLEFVRDPDWSEVSEWVEASGGDLVMITLAPERKGAVKLIERLSAEGIAVAIGHTAASETEIRRAVDAGARISTHLGNGSHAALPRLKNYLWTQLAEDRLSAGIISDGFHLPPDALRSIIRMKGSSRVILVSDAAPFAGTKPGPAKWGNMQIEVHNDGHISLAGTPYLAGAGHLLNHNIPLAIHHSDMNLQLAIDACTTQVDRLFSLSGYASSLVNPRRSMEPIPCENRDIVRFEWDEGWHDLIITHAVRNGRLAYLRSLESPDNGEIK